MSDFNIRPLCNIFTEHSEQSVFLRPMQTERKTCSTSMCHKRRVICHANDYNWYDGPLEIADLQENFFFVREKSGTVRLRLIRENNHTSHIGILCHLLAKCVKFSNYTFRLIQEYNIRIHTNTCCRTTTIIPNFKRYWQIYMLFAVVNGYNKFFTNFVIYSQPSAGARFDFVASHFYLVDGGERSLARLPKTECDTDQSAKIDKERRHVPFGSFASCIRCFPLRAQVGKAIVTPTVTSDIGLLVDGDWWLYKICSVITTCEVPPPIHSRNEHNSRGGTGGQSNSQTYFLLYRRPLLYRSFLKSLRHCAQSFLRKAPPPFSHVARLPSQADNLTYTRIQRNSRPKGERHISAPIAIADHERFSTWHPLGQWNKPNVFFVSALQHRKSSFQRSRAHLPKDIPIIELYCHKRCALFLDELLHLAGVDYHWDCTVEHLGLTRMQCAKTDRHVVQKPSRLFWENGSDFDFIGAMQIKSWRSSIIFDRSQYSDRLIVSFYSLNDRLQIGAVLTLLSILCLPKPEANGEQCHSGYYCRNHTPRRAVASRIRRFPLCAKVRTSHILGGIAGLLRRISRSLSNIGNINSARNLDFRWHFRRAFFRVRLSQAAER